MKKKLLAERLAEMINQMAEMSQNIQSIRSIQGVNSLCINKILKHCDELNRDEIEELEFSNHIQRPFLPSGYEQKILSLENKIKELEQRPEASGKFVKDFCELEKDRIKAAERIDELRRANEEIGVKYQRLLDTFDSVSAQLMESKRENHSLLEMFEREKSIYAADVDDLRLQASRAEYNLKEANDECRRLNFVILDFEQVLKEIVELEDDLMALSGIKSLLGPGHRGLMEQLESKIHSITNQERVNGLTNNRSEIT